MRGNRKINRRKIEHESDLRNYRNTMTSQPSKRFNLKLLTRDLFTLNPSHSILHPEHASYTNLRNDGFDQACISGLYA